LYDFRTWHLLSAVYADLRRRLVPFNCGRGLFELVKEI